MLTRNKYQVLIGVSSLIYLIMFSGCQKGSSEIDGETTYLQYCGSCHMASDPANIPKSIWINSVLPDMASRLGYEFIPPNQKFDFFVDEDIYTDQVIQKPAPAIDSGSWNQLYRYILSCSPDSIPPEKSRTNRLSSLKRFSPQSFSLEGNEGRSFISMIHFDLKNKRFMVGDSFRECAVTWPGDTTLKIGGHTVYFNSPVVSYRERNDNIYLVEIGEFLPSNNANGVLYQINQQGMNRVVDQLYRPVYLEIEDLNNDGSDEIIICEFGKRTGQLSMLVKTDSGFRKRSLLDTPGTVKVEVADMDKDGRKDIVVLASQGNEGIYILYNKGHLNFSPDLVIRKGPEYGSTWFELVDYNNDNYLDIVLACGDNADLSVFPKPYHGISIFLNNGSNQFEEKWFYPIYGATRVLAEDYDLDGDLDFAVMSFFPDYTIAPLEGFVYLKNMDQERYQFKAYGFQESLNGRWLVMEQGDFDDDGDVDIMLGSYTMNINRKHADIMEKWVDSGTNLQLLRNTTLDQ